MLLFIARISCFMHLTSINASTFLLDPPSEKHIALLYESNEQLGSTIALYINEGLRRGQFCVYATVHYRDDGHLEEFANHIVNYKENVEKGNLMVVDLAPFYIAALMGDMKPFEEARKLFAEKAKNMPDKHVRFVGDGTGFLFKHNHFDECMMIEEWWQEKPFEGSYVCPFEKQLFGAFPHEMHSHHSVISTHDVALDAPDKSRETKANNQQSQFSQNQTVQGYNSNTPSIDSTGELN